MDARSKGGLGAVQHRPFLLCQSVVLAWLLLWTLIFFRATRDWPLVNDAALMHYVSFLMDHGLRPYRDILDPNLPGSYLLDWTVIHTLGAGAAASRVYDELLLAVTAGSMLLIGWRRSKVVSLCAGCLFALFHGRDGMAQTGQRDLALAAALMLAIALALQISRHRSIAAAVGFGIVTGSAMTIKPYALLFVLLLIPLMRSVPVAQRGRVWISALSGVTVPLLALGIYLLRIGVLRDFLFVLFTLDPLHQRLGYVGAWHLVRAFLPPSLLLLAALGLLALRTDCDPAPIERDLLLTGMALGAVAYFIQLKGFPYHRYPFVACLLLFVAFEMDRTLRNAGRSRSIAYLGLCATVILAPLYARHGLQARWPNDLEIALEHDLNTSSFPLEGSVQCVDSIGGCTRVFYDMRLVQATGVLYDEFFFLPKAPAAILDRREQFLSTLERAKPKIFIVTPDLFPGGPNAYGKLQRWSGFNHLLATCYDKSVERTFPEGAPTESGYRLYELAPRCRA